MTSSREALGNQDKTCCINQLLLTNHLPVGILSQVATMGLLSLFLLNAACLRLCSARGRSPGPALYICREMWQLGSAASQSKH